MLANNVKLGVIAFHIIPKKVQTFHVRRHNYVIIADFGQISDFSEVL